MAACTLPRYKQGVNDSPGARDVVLDNKANRWLRRDLTAPWGEIIAVVAIVIGFSTVMSSLQAWRGSSRTYMGDLLTDWRLVHTVLIESGILGLLFIHLHWRGWRPADLTIKPTWWSSCVGLFLMPGMMLANSLTVVAGLLIFYALQPPSTRFSAFLFANSPHIPPHSVHVSWLAVAAAVIFNGFFEEITCMGYAFRQFAAKGGPLFALVVTVLLRMSCHTYQGVIHACGIGAAFLLFGLVYWRTQNLWPLIVAHILVDLASFGSIKVFFG